MPRVLVCGSINWDFIIFVERFPSPGEEIRAEKIISVGGGKGANTAVAVARILDHKEVGVIGTLGIDDIADKQIAILEKEGIDTTCIGRIENIGSGQAYIIVDGKGENMILTYKTANNMITPEMVTTDPIRSYIKGCEMIIIIDPPLAVASTLIREAKGNNKVIIWSPALLTRHGFSSLHELMNICDYIILNEHEAKLLASKDDPKVACMYISSRLDGKRVVTTLGSMGCILCWNGKSIVIPTMDLSIFGLKSVSTVGAGDTFVGVFCALLIKGFADIEALFMANIAAALKTTKEETRATPRYEEIRRYMNDEHIRRLYRDIHII